MKKDMKKIVTLLVIVLGFTMITLAEIWIPWEDWKYEGKSPCVHGVFRWDGGEKFINHVPSISGSCIFDPGYWGPYCELKIEE